MLMLAGTSSVMNNITIVSPPVFLSSDCLFSVCILNLRPQRFRSLQPLLELGLNTGKHHMRMLEASFCFYDNQPLHHDQRGPGLRDRNLGDEIWKAAFTEQYVA